MINVRGVSTVYAAIVIAFISISITSSLILYVHRLEESNAEFFREASEMIKASGEQIYIIQREKDISLCTNKEPYRISLAILANSTYMNISNVNSTCYVISKNELNNYLTRNYTLTLITELGNYYHFNLSTFSESEEGEGGLDGELLINDIRFLVITGYGPIITNPSEDFINPMYTYYDVYMYYISENYLVVDVKDGRALISRPNDLVLNITLPNGTWPVMYVYLVIPFSIGELANVNVVTNLTYSIWTENNDLGTLRVKAVMKIIRVQDILSGVPISPKYSIYEHTVYINNREVSLRYIPYLANDEEVLYWSTLPVDEHGIITLSTPLTTYCNNYILLLGLELTYLNRQGNVIHILMNVTNITIT